MADEIDEISAAALMASGVDVPSALAGSIVDKPQHHSKPTVWLWLAIALGLIIGLILAAKW